MGQGPMHADRQLRLVGLNKVKFISHPEISVLDMRRQWTVNDVGEFWDDSDQLTRG